MKKSKLFDIIAAAAFFNVVLLNMINFFSVIVVRHGHFAPETVVETIFDWLALSFCGVAAILSKRKLKMISWFVMAGVAFFEWAMSISEGIRFMDYMGVSFYGIHSFIFAPMYMLLAYVCLAALFLVSGILYKKNKKLPAILWLIPAVLYVINLFFGRLSLIGARYASYTFLSFLLGQLMLVGIIATCFGGLYEAAANGQHVPVFTGMAAADNARISQPQYARLNYAQPQYAQPQYAQPQYAQQNYAQQNYAQPQYGQPGAPSANKTDELLRAKALLDNGVITREEFEAIKRRVIG